MCLVGLVSLPLLYMQIADLPSNIMRGACSGTTYGSLFNNLLFIILECARSIPAVHAALYSLSVLYLATVPVTCVQWSIGTPWSNTIYALLLLPVYGQSWQIQSCNTVNWFSVSMMSCLNRSDRGTSSILAEYFNPKFLLSLIYLNKCTKPSKCTLPGFDENVSSLCTDKHKSSLVYKI